MQLKKNQQNNLLVFLERTQISGREAETFLNLVRDIQTAEIIDNNPLSEQQ